MNESLERRHQGTVEIGHRTALGADALTEWRTNAEHRAAQERGRAQWYQTCTLLVAQVERSHGFVRLALTPPGAHATT